MHPRKLVIIGSGPAAWTCAIYAARSNLTPLVFEGGGSAEIIPLGQLASTTAVENFPGFPPADMREMLRSALPEELQPWWVKRAKEQPTRSVDGPALVELMRHQANLFDAEILRRDVTSVDLRRQPFAVMDSDGIQTETKALVIATGARAKWLGLESEQKYRNHGVSACATCDGPFYRNQGVVVVGGGASAIEEATHLSHLAKVVYLVHRRDTFRAQHVMVERVRTNPVIQSIWNHVMDEVLGDGQHMTGVRVRNVHTGETKSIEARGMFVAIGHDPNTGFLNGQVETDKLGYIRLRESWRTATNIPGVFAAGDVADARYRQAITAAAMGCMAALDAERWLTEQGVR